MDETRSPGHLGDDEHCGPRTMNFVHGSAKPYDPSDSPSCDPARRVDLGLGNPESASIGKAEPPTSGHRLLSVGELAVRLNVSPAWIYSRTARNSIPHRRLGAHIRFEWTDIEDWFRTGCPDQARSVSDTAADRAPRLARKVG